MTGDSTRPPLCGRRSGSLEVWKMKWRLPREGSGERRRCTGPLRGWAATSSSSMPRKSRWTRNPTPNATGLINGSRLVLPT